LATKTAGTKTVPGGQELPTHFTEQWKYLCQFVAIKLFVVAVEA
jgi:hypothetical protein